MQIWSRRSVRGRVARGALAVVGMAFAALLAASPAQAQDKGKTERSNARVDKYDAAAATLVIKDKGKETTFNVKAEGTVLTRTTVTMNARPAKLDDLKPNQVVVVYWRPNDANAEQKDARKIDIPNIPEGMEPEDGE
ncbi:hypothetical protein GPROT1_01315 [Gammaproteobacteria bacterium]|nr:hypothetical protein GPROT1_01315 [Gammaproteobacteria bacterium]